MDDIDAICTPENERDWLRFYQASSGANATETFVAFMKYMKGDEIPEITTGEYHEMEFFHGHDDPSSHTINYACSSLKLEDLETIMDSSKGLDKYGMSWFANWTRSQCPTIRILSPCDMTDAMEVGAKNIPTDHLDIASTKAGFRKSQGGHTFDEVWIPFRRFASYLVKIQMATRAISVSLCSTSSHKDALSKLREWIDVQWGPWAERIYNITADWPLTLHYHVDRTTDWHSTNIVCLELLQKASGGKYSAYKANKNPKRLRVFVVYKCVEIANAEVEHPGHSYKHPSLLSEADLANS